MDALATNKLETTFGEFEVTLYGKSAEEKCLLLVRRPWGECPFVRLHSACLFGESFHARDCDCALQLDASVEYASKQGGLVVYLFQEGRGLGLLGKMRAIAQQQQRNVDTAAAFQSLGQELDPRDYGIVGEAFRYLRVPKRIRLATNNPLKVRALEAMGYEIQERVILDFPRSPEVEAYINMKAKVLGHYDAS